MMMKGCTRCGGMLLMEEEGRFLDLVCLQCGHRPKNGPRIAAVIRQARINSRTGIGQTWPFRAELPAGQDAA